MINNPSLIKKAIKEIQSLQYTDILKVLKEMEE